MRLSRLILLIFATIIGFGLFSLVVYSIYAQNDDLTPIYTNTAPEQFTWSINSTSFVFLGSTAQRGVQIADPNWYSYDVATAMLNPSATWPLQPVLTPAEIASFNPFLVGNTTFMFVSPNGRYLVYTIQDTQVLALGDRLLEQSYLIPDVTIPGPTTGTDQFKVLWSADSTAFTVIFASAYSDEFGTLYVRGFADNPVTIEMIPIGATLVDGRAFRYLKVYDISADGNLVLLSGIEVFPNTDLPPSRLKIILWNPSSPEDGEIFDMFTGEIKGASFEADENTLLIVNEQGLVRFDRTTGEIAILNSDIGVGWVSQALFSPDGEHAALIHEDLNAGNKTISIIHIADVVTPTEIPEVSDTPTLIPTASATPTFTPTPTPTTFPETEVLDTFNRVDGGLGGDWSGATGSYGIAGNQVAVAGDGDIYWNAAAFSADQEVFVTLAGINPNAEEIGLLLKRQGTSALKSRSSRFGATGRL